MKCPNCSAECTDQSLECDFCGHPFVDGLESAAVTPPAPPVSMAKPPMQMAPDSPPPVQPYPDSAPPASRQNPKVPNYLVWAIVSTVIATLATMFSCCCLETGEVSSAEQASKNAKLWTWVTTVIAILFGILVLASFILQATGYLDKDYLEDLRKQIEASR